MMKPNLDIGLGYVLAHEAELQTQYAGREGKQHFFFYTDAAGRDFLVSVKERDISFQHGNLIEVTSYDKKRLEDMDEEEIPRNVLNRLPKEAQA